MTTTTAPPFAITSILTPGAPGGRAMYAVVNCRGCPASDRVLVSGKSAAWAQRVLRQKGWSLSEHNRMRHLCPACVKGGRHGSGRLKTALGMASSMDGATGAELHVTPPGHPSGLTVATVNISPEDITVVDKQQMAAALAHLGHVKVATSPGEPRGAPRRVTGNYRGDAASRTHLPVGRRPDGLVGAYVVAVENPRKHQQRARTFKTGGFRYPSDAAIRALEYCAAAGIENPQLGEHFTLWRRDGHDCGWALVEPEEPPTSVTLTLDTVEGASGHQIIKQAGALLTDSYEQPTAHPAAMVAPDFKPLPAHIVVTPKEETRVIEPIPPKEAPALTAEPPPMPTRPDIRAIQDALDIAYNLQAQRYCGAETDASIAGRLKMPRAWVTAERERAYGPDGNEAADLALAKWRSTVTEKVDALTAELLALAAEAESLKLLVEGGPK